MYTNHRRLPPSRTRGRALGRALLLAVPCLLWIMAGNLLANDLPPLAQQAYVKASNSGFSDQFGISVALWGDTLVVGAQGERSAATGIGGDQADDSADTASSTS